MSRCSSPWSASRCCPTGFSRSSSIIGAQGVLIRIQHEQAEAAAAKIGQFIKEIESQLGWTTQLPWSAGSCRAAPVRCASPVAAGAGDHRTVADRFARQGAPAGVAAGHGRRRQRPRPLQGPKFTEAVANKVYYGPVYFRRESEPYMTLSLAGTRKDAGVSIAEVNLKLIWDVVSQIKVGERGHAYVVGAQGRLIAHPDISLVLRNTDMSKLSRCRPRWRSRPCWRSRRPRLPHRPRLRGGQRRQHLRRHRRLRGQRPRIRIPCKGR
jgi:hypothetical protein